MSGPFGASPWGYNPSTGFYDHTIGQSLRLNGTNAYLSKTDFGTATNTSKRTFSTWIKTCDDSYTSYDHIVGSGSSNIDGFGFDSNAKFAFLRLGADVQTGTAQIRDVSAWMHVMFTWDSTAGNWYIYINGVQDSTGSASAALTKLGQSGQTNTIGKRSNAGQYIHGYLAQTVFLDGTIGSVNDFGETKDGIWVPKDISAAGLTFGTNGYFLDYADSSDLGKDVSGQGNHWTSNNLTAEDQVSDTPTNNFATFNKIVAYKATTDPAFSEGNLKTAPESDGIGYEYTGVSSTINVSSGKWYAEFKPTATSGSSVAYLIGIIEEGLDRMTSNASNNTWDGGFVYTGAGQIRGSGNVITSSWGDTYTTDDVIGVAIDMDDGKVWFSKNGTFQASGDPAAGTNAAFTTLKTYKNTYAFSVGCGQTSSQYHQYEGNFGQNPSFNGTFTGGDVGTQTDGNGIGLFKYAPPSGFLALCTSNLPDITIGPGQDTQADDNFNTVLYTGDSDNDVTVTNTFAADWVWLKIRESSSGTTQHFLQDTVRGFGASKSLSSSSTGSEGYTGSYQSSQNIVTTNSSLQIVSQDFAENGKTYVAWTWKAGGSSNTFNIDGTGYSSASDAGLSGGNITPTGASINTTAGFSIISYTGNETANQTIKHGLSSAPEFSIIKCRDSNTNNNQWQLSSSQIGDDYFYFTTTGATGVAGVFPTSGDATTVTIGRTGNNVKNTNENNKNFIMYNFHSVEGYSKFGTYIGNGSADGPFVFTGFRPHFLISTCKIGGTGNWFMLDTTRSTFNEADDRLNADVNSTESTSNSDIDFLSNGFKLRTASTAGINQNTDTMFYFAFAEAPFKFANAR
tara:strand:- start:379 stop:2922 length:2544 start_codon:yes stop_codon:yes gene_type:complete